MTVENKRVEVTLETQLDSVDLAENITLCVAEAAGFDEDTRYRIGMSVREAVINAVEYGNQHSTSKKVFLEVSLKPEKLVIHVRDQGSGLDLSQVPDPLDEENLLKSSGRGIFLMRAFMDEFDVRQAADGGAEVILAKRYPDAQPASPGAAKSKED